jgi:hypothetical protein
MGWDKYSELGGGAGDGQMVKKKKVRALRLSQRILFHFR